MNISFSHGNGIAIEIGKEKILLDPKVSDYISFVSHAHLDHVPKEIVKKPYCTEETYELIKVRNPNFDANVVKEGKAIKFDNFSVKLLNAGHILGATQTFIEANGVSILYTGDFKLWKGLTCEAAKIQEADVVIMEATYGHPSYQLPHVETVREQIIKWVKKHSKDFSINVGAYELGKSQEVIKLLNMNGIVPKVSAGIKRISEIYQKFGIDLEYTENGSSIAVRPMYMIPKMDDENSKSCVLTGWSLFRNYGVQGFPLSDHCDFNQLLQFIEQISPKKVFCVHGFEDELISAIKAKLKIPAQKLQKRSQGLLTDF